MTFDIDISGFTFKEGCYTGRINGVYTDKWIGDTPSNYVKQKFHMCLISSVLKGNLNN